MGCFASYINEGIDIAFGVMFSTSHGAEQRYVAGAVALHEPKNSVAQFLDRGSDSHWGYCALQVLYRLAGIY